MCLVSLFSHGIREDDMTAWEQGDPEQAASAPYHHYHTIYTRRLRTTHPQATKGLRAGGYHTGQLLDTVRAMGLLHIRPKDPSPLTPYIISP